MHGTLSTAITSSNIQTQSVERVLMLQGPLVVPRNKTNDVYVFVAFSSRHKLWERGRLDGLIRGGTAAMATHD